MCKVLDWIKIEKLVQVLTYACYNGFHTKVSKIGKTMFAVATLEQTRSKNLVLAVAFLAFYWQKVYSADKSIFLPADGLNCLPSVTIVVNSITMIRITSLGRVSSSLSCSPIQADSPDLSDPSLRANPPPNRIKTPHGI